MCTAIQVDCVLTMQINHPTYLTGVERSGIGKDGIFSSDYVSLVRSATNRLSCDMVKMAKCGVASQISPAALNRKDVKKDQLAEWLYTAYYLLERCSLPLMGLAAKQNGKIEKLQNEKISDQEKIIELQNRVIENKEEEMNVVKETVSSELKSYKSVLQIGLQESCSAALHPQKIATAVKKVTEGEDRSKNVIVFGLPEEKEENVDSKVESLLEKLDERPHTSDCRRIGQNKPGIPRPIRFKVRTSDVAYQILRKAKKLKETAGYERVFISPDRTVEERISRQKLVIELKEKRTANPHKNYMIRKGEVVFISERSGCVQNC